MSTLCLHEKLQAIIVLFLYFAIPCNAQNLITRDVVTGLNTPWEILWGPDNWIWVTERSGRISRVNPQSGELRPVYTIPDVHQTGESGLLGMTLHPNFLDTPYVVVTYTYLSSNQIRQRVVRYRYENETLITSLVLLNDLPANTIHDGSRLIIAPDRTLYVTTGDAGNQSLSQDLQSYNGKILRMNLDGTVPPDNPWQESHVWSQGHRNPQGLVLVNGILYSSEHGPTTDDEVNIISRGRNYGWPNVMGYCNTPSEQSFCNANNVVEPIATWTPTIAPCGLDYYASASLPEWENSLLLVTLRASRLVQLKLNSARTIVVEQKEFCVNQFGRLRDLCVSPQGKVYIATSNRDGRAVSPFPRTGDDRIVEISPAGVTSVELQSGASHGALVLHSTHPNPFNSTATVRLFLDQPRSLILKVFDALGREVATLVDGTLDAGQHAIVFDAAGLASGIFFCRLQTDDRSETKKMVLAR